MKRLSLLLLLVLCCCVACNRTGGVPETLVTSGYDEQEMEAAMARARSEVDSFLHELSNPTGESHAIKIPITDGEQTEYFWLNELSYENGHFEGTINNEPGLVSNVRIGDKRKVEKLAIADWMFMRAGKMHGNYTMRPLLKSMPADEAEQYRSLLANP